MSPLHPETAEDKMAQVPLFCCALPIALVIIGAIVVLVVF